ncbi:MAG: acylphosphatase [Flavobacteriales bacterium]|nr:acylphosphatase [Flavobacteriales bacterium]
MELSIQIRISGKVQGVGFRRNLQSKALSLDLCGKVWNTSGGEVMVNVWGPKTQVMQLLEWCQHGPRFAKVDSLQWVEIERGGENEFIITNEE